MCSNNANQRELESWFLLKLVAPVKGIRLQGSAANLSNRVIGGVRPLLDGAKRR